MRRLALLLLLCSTEVLAHANYDPWCCDNKDCAPYPFEKIVLRADGYFLPEFNTLIRFTNDTRLRDPLDAQFHVCEYPKGVVRCFYPQAGGV